MKRKHHLKLASLSNRYSLRCGHDVRLRFRPYLCTCVAAMDLHISGLIFAFFASALLFQLVFEVRFL